jgi:hypothetical protein
MSSAADPVLCTVLADVLRESEKKMRESMAQAERKVGESQGKNLAAAAGGPKGKGGNAGEGSTKGAAKEEGSKKQEESRKVDKGPGNEAREKRDAKQKGKEKKAAGKESKGGKEKGPEKKAAEPVVGAKSKPKVVEEQPPAPESAVESKLPEVKEESQSVAPEVPPPALVIVPEAPTVKSAPEPGTEELLVFEKEFTLPAGVDEGMPGGAEEEEWVNVTSRRKLRESLKGSAQTPEAERPLSARQRRAKQKEAARALPRESPERVVHQSPPREELLVPVELPTVQVPESTPVGTPNPKETAWGVVEAPGPAKVVPSGSEEDERGGVGRTAWGPNAQPGGHLAKRSWAEQVEEEDKSGGAAEGPAQSLPLVSRRV